MNYYIIITQTSGRIYSNRGFLLSSFLNILTEIKTKEVIKMWLEQIIKGFLALREWIKDFLKSSKNKQPDNNQLLAAGVDDSNEIIQAQRYLRLMGFPIGSAGSNQDGVDGIMGVMTEAAVSIFQQMLNIESNGTLTQETLTKLSQVYQDGMGFRKLTLDAYREGIRPNFNVNDGKQATFVNTVYFYAVVDENVLKIPVAATTAQAVLETGYGRYIPVDKDSGQISYNLFGIKGTGPAGSVTCITHEEEPESGRWKSIIQQFRAYNSFEESIHDHSRFFYDNQRYREALETENPEDFIRKIAQAGYATDSNYAAKLILIIKYWGLV